MVASVERVRMDGERAIAPYVELSFGVMGKTLPADHGYGLYCSDTPPIRCDNLMLSQISRGVKHPHGVEHYARVGTLFQLLNHRCRKALTQLSGIANVAILSGVHVCTCGHALCMREADIITIGACFLQRWCAKNKKRALVQKLYTKTQVVYFLVVMLTPKRDFLLEVAQRLVRERGITNPPEFWKLEDRELELFIEVYLWQFLRRVSVS